jgi:flavin reductase (DIM6/NTAB) family NADH-FMN oxidoreductase RutF
LRDVVADGVTAFETISGLLNYPMFVVTTANSDERSGCLVGFTTQVSIAPRRFLVCLSIKNRTFRVATDARHLVVHLLAAEEQDLARLFGEQTGDHVDKFARCRWTPGPDGVPVLDDATAWFAGRIVERLPLGDHVGFVIEPDDGQVRRRTRDLASFADMASMQPGHDA